MAFLIIYAWFRRLIGAVNRDGLIRDLLAENLVLRHRLAEKFTSTVGRHG